MVETPVARLSTVKRASIEATSLARRVQADHGLTRPRSSARRCWSVGRSAESLGLPESLELPEASESPVSEKPTPGAKTSGSAASSTSGRSDGSGRSPGGVGWVSSAWSDGRLEDIPRPSHGVDHRLAAGVDLLAQVGDVELDDVGLAAEVVVPHPVEDLGLGEHALGVAHEEAQQLELGGGELDELVGPADLVAVLVEHEIADDQLGTLPRGRHAGAAQQPAQPRDQLLEAE